QCALIVIGARGQGAIASALLGSVSQALVHASPVPVTIVKHADLSATAQPADLPGGGGEPDPV
ncbi:universal stress protein, partial [Enterococcus faecium]|uniref:universal stress protein n=3 Tax=Bacteria TaxID=2 RepID=UPI001650C222